MLNMQYEIGQRDYSAPELQLDLSFNGEMVDLDFSQFNSSELTLDEFRHFIDMMDHAHEVMEQYND